MVWQGVRISIGQPSPHCQRVKGTSSMCVCAYDIYVYIACIFTPRAMPCLQELLNCLGLARKSLKPYAVCTSRRESTRASSCHQTAIPTVNRQQINSKKLVASTSVCQRRPSTRFVAFVPIQVIYSKYFVIINFHLYVTWPRALSARIIPSLAHKLTCARHGTDPNRHYSRFWDATRRQSARHT
jgi:hypothetical protein